jgi:hypothetical protein
MSRSIKKIFFPKTRLTELAARSGGVTRETALDGALKNLNDSRADADITIEKSICALEAIVADSRGGLLTEADMRDVLRYSDQIVTLAGTFGYDSLDSAVKNLCDVTDGLLSAKLFHAAPIAVHIRAMRMFCPGAPPMAAGPTEKILSELGKILTHYNFSRLDIPQEEDIAENAS